MLAQTLQLLRDADLSYVDGVPTEATVHRVTEAAKLAFADREAWYGDSAPVPLAALLARAYAAERRALIADTASLELRPGVPRRAGDRGCRPHVRRRAGTPAPRPRPARAAVALGEPTVGPDGAMRGDTVHIDVVDAAGNMVSATPSGGWLQSSPTIPALGFCLGTRGQMFWLEDGLASSLKPGRRPRTTLSPSLGLRDGEPVLAFGTPGGDQQDQWQLCFWLAHTVGGLDLQAAIDAPTWHSTGVPVRRSRRAGGSRVGSSPSPGSAGRRSRRCAAAATTSPTQAPGRWAGAAPWAAATSCAPPADPRSGYGGAAALLPRPLTRRGRITARRARLRLADPPLCAHTERRPPP